MFSHLRSARPPPVAQFSLKTRLVLGMGVPFRERALAAAAGEEKSTKQYPALLLLPTLGPRYLIWGLSGSVLPRELVADHLDIDLLAHLEPQVADEVLIDPGLKLTHPECGVSKTYTDTGGTARENETYQRVVLPSAPCWGTGAAEASPGGGPWKGAPSAVPAMAVSAGAGAPAAAAGSWLGKESKFWKDILKSEIRKSRRKNIKRSATETSWSR